MRYKVLTSLTIIAATIALVGGATMAWFTDSVDVPEASFTAGTVEIRAGQTVKADEGYSIDYREYLAEVAENPVRVVENFQGSAGADGAGTVRDKRSVPNAVLEYETGSAESNFFSLGFGGHIIVKFQNPISNRDAVVVVEDTWGLPYPLESAKVYVGDYDEEHEDKGEWHELGIATNKDKDVNQTVNFFMVDTEEDFEANYVKIVDTSVADDFENIADQSSVDGFDVNAIMAINSPLFDEGNWNPGDNDIRAYYVTNVGTKDIYVRAIISGEWFEFVKDEEEDEGEWVEWTPQHDDPDIEAVSISVINEEDWDEVDEYYYYKHRLDGTYGPRASPTAELILSVDLDGPKTDNQYQGMRFVLSVEFEAIQSSNEASVDRWGWSPGED